MAVLMVMEVLEATMTWILAFLVKMVVVMEVASMTQSHLICTLGKYRNMNITSQNITGSTRSFVTLMMEMAVVTMTCVPASLMVVMVVMELVEVTMTWVLGHPLTSILCRHGQPCQ